MTVNGRTTLVTTLAVLLVSGAADARAASFSTKILDAGWDGDNHYVSGALVTDRKPEAFPCVEGRTIVVKSLKTGKVVGTGKSKGGSSPGVFRVSLGGFAPVGRYKVIAKAKRIGANTCEQGSVTLRQPYPEND